MNRKIHLGCGDHILDGWDNLDAKSHNKKVIKCNLRRRLPYPDNSVSAIYSCHVFEHLNISDGLKLMKECYRILQKEGVVRIIVPDLDLILWAYNNWENKEEINKIFPVGIHKENDNLDKRDWLKWCLYDNSKEDRNGTHKITYQNKLPINQLKKAKEWLKWRLYKNYTEYKTETHKITYWDKLLINQLKKAGFSDVQKTSDNNSKSKHEFFKKIENFPNKSLAVEGIKK